MRTSRISGQWRSSAQAGGSPLVGCLWDRRRGHTYRSQGGQGAKKVHFKTKDGLNSSVKFQVTKAKKPLAVVSKITQKGNCVCFWPSEAYIENVATVKSTDLELHNGGQEVRFSKKNFPT